LKGGMSKMRRAATGRGDHEDTGTPLRFWADAAALAAAAAVALMVASGGGEAGADPGDPADLSLTKSDSPDPVVEDGVLTYTLKVENAGPDPATNVVVSDDLPGQVDPVSAEPSGNCDIQGKKVNCELGTLASGASATVTIEVTPKKAGLITNEAEVESEVEDLQTANNRDTVNTSVTEGAPGGATCKKQAATIEGTDAGETLTGTEGKDVILARGGDDQINAGSEKDLVCAGDGNDLTRSGGGNDFAKGQGGSDTAKGQGGGDTLKGNRGGDDLRGGSGSDLLAGGKGRDRCKGGAGSDALRTCNP
jgi:uncharacterized repeat protein (TIGR01451 family)